MTLPSPEPAPQNLCSRRRVLASTLGILSAPATSELLRAALTLSAQSTEPANAAVKVADEGAGRYIVTTISGLKYYDFNLGTGELIVDRGRSATFHYTFGTTGARNGWKIDSTHDQGRSPLTLTIGAGQVIEGLDECLHGMREGGRRRCLIPSDLGFESSANKPSPPGFAEYQRFKNLYLNKDRQYKPDAVFDIEMLRVR
jgi:FKBP-type peptidyl-prolyl cis-trans isomerase